jgi:hypothetical protein
VETADIAIAAAEQWIDAAKEHERQARELRKAAKDLLDGTAPVQMIGDDTIVQITKHSVLKWKAGA